ncbi:MAG: tripartite tricarboxylate transporter substrate binding protein [Rhodospirillales bacterium]|nr:tripartite tricarboxylate transporter substrate binding protein [Rhodospirillales bacterium]
MKMLKALTLGAAALLVVGGTAVAASDYPSRTIEIVVPSGSGGGQDTLVRYIQPLLEKELGVSVRVTNVPGGAHTKGIMYAYSAPADGYLIHCESPSGVIADVFKKMPIKFVEEFVPVARFQRERGYLWTGANGRFKTLQELIDFAKKNPGKVTVAISSPGGVDDASLGTFADAAGIKVSIVPINSGGERMAATIAGHVDLMYEEFSAVGDMMKAGQLIPLVGLMNERIDTPDLKDIPAAGEFGMKGWELAGTWRGFAVRKGTPQPIVDKLAATFKKVYDSEKYQQYAKENGLDVVPGWMGPEEFGKLWEDNYTAFAKVFKRLGRIE